MRQLRTGRLKKSTNTITFIGKRTGKLYVYVKNKLKYKKMAYEKINGRKGEMVDGLFIKEGDLND